MAQLPDFSVFSESFRRDRPIIGLGRFIVCHKGTVGRDKLFSLTSFIQAITLPLCLLLLGCAGGSHGTRLERSITGTLLDFEMRPIPNAAISFNGVPVTQTDESGFFVIEQGVEPGAVEISVDVDGRQESVSFEYPDVEMLQIELTLDPVEGLDITDSDHSGINTPAKADPLEPQENEETSPPGTGSPSSAADQPKDTSKPKKPKDSADEQDSGSTTDTDPPVTDENPPSDQDSDVTDQDGGQDPPASDQGGGGSDDGGESDQGGESEGGEGGGESSGGGGECPPEQVCDGNPPPHD